MTTRNSQKAPRSPRSRPSEGAPIVLTPELETALDTFNRAHIRAMRAAGMFEPGYQPPHASQDAEKGQPE